MKHCYPVLFFFFFLIFRLSAQTPGTPEHLFFSKEENTFTTPSENFSRTYARTACGLKFTTAHAVLGKRYALSGAVNQPAPLTLSGLPCDADLVIEKAFLYWIIERWTPVGNSSLTLSNPQNQNANVSGTLIATYRQGRCWACEHTEHYRADVTAHIAGNGNYRIAGLPQNTVCTDGDTDGIALVVVYRDKSDPDEGTFILYDGMMLSASGTFTQTITGINACRTPKEAQGLSIIGDFQDNAPGPWSVRFGNDTYPVTPRFFNVERHPVTPGSLVGVNTFAHRVTGTTDCFSWIASGLYYQTDCNPGCPAPPSPGTLSAHQTLCPGFAPQTLTLSNFSGTILRWESSFDGGNNWNPIAHTLPSYNPVGLNDRNARFRVVLQGGNCGSVTSNDISITFSGNTPLQAGAVASNQTVCAGQIPAPLELSGHDGTVLRWEVSNGCTGNWQPVIHTGTRFSPPVLTAAICYRAVVRGAGNCPETGPSDMVRLSVSPPAAGGTIAPQTVCENQSAVLTLTRHSGNVVRWERSSDCSFTAGIEALPVPFSTYNVPQMNVSACFRAWVSDVNGNCPPVASDTARVTVVPISLGGTVSGNVTVCTGASPGNLTLMGHRGTILRWERSSDCPAFGTVQTIAFTGSVYISPVLNENTCFRAVIKNGICETAFSAPLTVRLRPGGSPGSLSDPQTVCTGNAPNPLRLTGHSGRIIRWQSSDDGGRNWQNISHTGITYAPPAVNRPTLFRTETADSFCGHLFTPPLAVAADTPAVDGRILSDQTICAGGSAELTLTGREGNVLRWETKSLTGNWTAVNHFQNTYTVTDLRITTRFRAVIRRGVCPPVVSDSSTITVNPPPVGGTVATPQTLCPQNQGTNLTLSGFAGNILRWESRTGNNNWQLIQHTSATLSVPPLSRTTAFRAVIGRNPCNETLSSEVILTVLPDTAAGTLTASQTACQNFNPLNLTGHTGTILRWERSDDGGNNWQPQAGAGTLAQFTPDFGVGIVFYRVILAEGNCPPMPTQPVSVTGISPDANGQITGPASVCENQPVTLTLTGFAGTILRWETRPAGSNTWQTVAHTLSVYTVPALSRSTEFRAVLQPAGCGVSYSLSITVGLLPQPSAGTLSGNRDICQNETPPILTLSGHSAGVLRWESGPGDCSTFPVPIPVTTATYRPMNLASSRCFRAAVGAANCPPVYSAPVRVGVFMPPMPGSLTGPASICQNGTTSLTLFGNTGEILRWEKSRNQLFTTLEVIASTVSRLTDTLRSSACYRVRIQGNSCPDTVTAPFCVSISDSAKGGLLTENQTLCAGEPARKLTLTGFTGTVAGWEAAENRNFTNFTFIPHFSPEYSPGTLTRNTCFRVRITSGACPSAYSSAVCIEIIPGPTEGILTGTAHVCASNPRTTLTLRGFAGNIVRREYSTDNFQTMTAVPSSESVFETPELNERTCFRVFLQNGNCPGRFSPPFCVDVSPETQAGTLTGPAEICIRPGSGTLTLSNFSGQILRWEHSPSADFQTVYPIANTNSEYRFTNLSEKTCFRAAVQSGVCAVKYSSVHCVNVIKEPVGGRVNGSRNVICSGGLPGEFRLTDFYGEIIRWESSTDGFQTQITPLNQTENPLRPDTLHEVQTICYRAVVRNGICGEQNAVPACVKVEAGPAGGQVLRDDTLCFGSASGTVVLTGHEGFITRWESSSDDFNTVTTHAYVSHIFIFNNLTQTTFFRAVTAKGTCEEIFSRPAKITVSAPEIALEVISQVGCRAGNSGGLKAVLTGGMAPYRVLWSRADGTQVGSGNEVSGLKAGTYCASGTDAAGCAFYGCITLKEPSELDLFFTYKKDLTCFNSRNGKITLEVRGGEPPYAYRWSDGLPHVDFNDFSAGTYHVTLTDAFGCEKYLSNITLTEPPALVSIVSYVKPNRCYGQNRGAIGQYVYGGVMPYRFLWSHGATTEDAQDLTAGTYTYTATDAAGCILTGSYTITEPPELNIRLITVTSPSCNGKNDGTIEAEVSGGSAPFWYSWSTGESGRDPHRLTGLPPGTYLLTVRDANGCGSQAQTVLKAPAPLKIWKSEMKTVSCEGKNDGSVKLEFTGGTGPYQIRWADAETETTFERTNLAPGIYSYTLTDAKGCTLQDTISVSASSVITARLSYIKAVTCFGKADGRMGHDIRGGTEPYRYLWSSGQTTEDLINLSSGIYTLTVSDAKGCTGVFSYFIPQPEPLTLKAINITSPRCGGTATGSIQLQASGGNPPYQFIGSHGGRTALATGLRAGTHYFYVWDTEDCLAFLSVTLTEPPPLSVEYSSLINPRCAGSFDGRAEIRVTGGTEPHQITWLSGGTGPKKEGLGPGSGGVLVRDGSGCVVFKTYTLTAPAAVRLIWQRIIPVSCNEKGSIAVQISGTEPLTYQWNTGQTTQNLYDLTRPGIYSLSVTDGNGCITNFSFDLPGTSGLSLRSVNIESERCNASGSIRVSISGGRSPYRYRWSGPAGLIRRNSGFVFGLKAGIYSLEIMDSEGCRLTENFTVPLQRALSFTIEEMTVPSCATAFGSITLSGKGGTPPYTFRWSDGETGAVRMNLPGGTYVVKMRDASGCDKDTTFVLPVFSPLKKERLTVKQPGCRSSGRIEISISGGTAPIHYRWSNGGENMPFISDLLPGTYSLTVSDKNGCALEIPNIVLAPAQNEIRPALTRKKDPECHLPNGFLEIRPSGGTAPYQIRWSNGFSGTFNGNLTAGTHSVTVTDAGGCNSVQSFELKHPFPKLTDESPAFEPILCAGNRNGSLTARISGGSPPLSYRWSNGRTDAIISGLSAGTYTVTVTDGAGCVLTGRYQLTEPLPLRLNVLESIPASCGTCTDAGLRVRASEGVLPYRYRINRGTFQNVGDFMNLEAGKNFTLEAEDGNGCRVSLNLTTDSPHPCEKPQVPQAMSPGSREALIYWGAVPGANEYFLSYRKVPGGNWTEIALSGFNQTYRLTGLHPGSRYEIRLLARCGDVRSEVSESGFFTTRAPRESESETRSGVRVYPVPVKEYLYISIPENELPVALSLTDVNGKTLWESKALPAEKDFFILEMSDFPAGVYVLKAGSQRVKVVKE